MTASSTECRVIGQFVGAAVTSGVAIIGILIAFFVYGTDRFESGVERGSSVTEKLTGFQDQLNQSRRDRDKQTDRILKALRGIERRVSKDARIK